jgi:hypothetical protein
MILGRKRTEIKTNLFIYPNEFGILYRFPIIQQDGLRLASAKDIAGMKMLAIVTGNRKKDFWDIHELLEYYSLEELIQWGLERNPYTLNRESILKAFDKMDSLDDDAPIQCLKGKYWEFIKEDLKEKIDIYRKRG